MKRSSDSRGIIDQRKLDANTLIDTTSLVAKYDVLVRENAPEAMSAERAVMLFQVLDSVLPHMGVFKPLVNQIRNELFEYVFSSEHHTGQLRTPATAAASAGPVSTAERSERSDSTGGFVRRVPHFALLGQLMGSQDDVARRLLEQIDILQESLFKKNCQFEDAMETIAARNADVEDKLREIAAAGTVVAEKENSISRLKQDIELVRHNWEKSKRMSDMEIKSLKADLQEKDEEIKYLRKYKQGYDVLNDAFQDDPALDAALLTASISKKVPVLSTRKENLISSVRSANKFEKQLLSVMNTVIEEYDQFVEEQKSELSKIDLVNEEDIVLQKKYEREIDRADQELWSVQEKFKKTVTDLNVELSLLVQHRAMFEEELQKIEEAEHDRIASDLAAAAERVKRPLRRVKLDGPQNEPNPNDKITREEIRNFSLNANDQDSTEPRDDPFIPHERVMSKYAVMLFYSQDGGQHFHLHQDCKYCESCEEKTVACPHKVIGEEGVVMQMPHRVSHLRLRRPPVRITRERTMSWEAEAGSMVDAVNYKTGGSDMDDDALSIVSAHTDASSAVSGARKPESRGAASRTEERGPSGLEVHPLSIILDDYKERAGAPLAVRRSLGVDRVLSLLEQFYAFVIGQDDAVTADNTGEYQSIVDKVYGFFTGHYLEERAAHVAAYDFLSGVIEYAASNRMLQLFANSLAGNIDFSVCRYALLLSNHIDQVKWLHIEDVRSLLGWMYPFLQDDDVESLQMGYVSFAENKLSNALVQDYLLYIILKGREPRILEMEHQLVQFPSRKQGVMADEEFAEATDHILQLSNETLRKWLFLESECLLLQQSEDDEAADEEEVPHMPVMKLAQILAYLQLLEYTQNARDNVGTVVEKNRAKDAEQAIPTMPVTGSLKDYPIVTMNGIRNLSYNLARRDRFRKEREMPDDSGEQR